MPTTVATPTLSPPVLHSKRAQRDLAGEVLTPLKQIRVPSSAVGYGAWCYYLRPNGETLRDVLILTPNGGNAPDNPDPKLRTRFSTNASYYHDRARAKGWEVLGPKLTIQGVRRIVEILVANREEGVAYCEDEIAMCDYTIANTGIEKDRMIAHKRKQQFQKRLATVLAPFDPDELIAELDEISRAQRMAELDPVMRAAVAEMVTAQIGTQVTTKFEEMVEHFTSGSAKEASPDLAGMRITRGKAEMFDD